MFTTTYRPKTPTDFVGNKNAADSLTSWLLKWTPDDNKNKSALIFGLCGIGKSLVAEMVLNQHNYNIINVALDVDRNKDYLNNVIKPLIKTKKTIDGKNNVLVVSDIDSGNDYGFIATLTECIKESQIPIICICDNRYDQNIKPIINYCLDIKMVKPTYPEVYRLMNRVILAEKLKIKESEINDLYEQSNGDIRFMLNTLQFGLIKNKKNIQSANIFETTASLFSMDESLFSMGDSKYETYWAANDLHPLMIHENYISNTFCVKDEVKKMDNLAYSADALADADLFETRINMSANWEFGPYVGVSTIQATLTCNKKTMIKFPQFLGRTSLMNKNKREKMNYEEVSFFEKEINIKSVKALKEKVVKVAKEKVVKEKVVKEKVVKEKVVKVAKEKVVKEKVLKVAKEKVVKKIIGV